MAKDIDDGDVQDGPELAQDLVGQQGAKEGGEVAKECKGVIDDGRGVFGKVQLVLDVDGEDGCKDMVVRQQVEKRSGNDLETRARQALEPLWVFSLPSFYAHAQIV